MAEAAHAVGNKVFVYTEGLETITADADQKARTFFKDHPDWVQRDISGRPAVFGGGDAFWISQGDEDVWITPYAMEWREIFMERIRQIAATGIDGVFVDIPYWMTHFDGWEDTWASFDNYTLAAFKAVSGLNARIDLKLGDFSDPNFLQWVDFRIRTLTEFMKEVADWFSEQDFINLIKNKDEHRIMFSENITYFDGEEVVRFSKEYRGKIVEPRGSGISIENVSEFNGSTLGEKRAEGSFSHKPDEYVWYDFAKWFATK